MAISPFIDSALLLVYGDTGDEYLVTTARDLGAALKHFRTAAGVTQVDAAEAMGIGQPYLSSLEGASSAAR